MALPIEDYALIGDLHSAALVGKDGSVDWLCLPRFDSGACFAALLGEPRHGRWLLAPAGAPRCTRRRYRERTLVLETEFETASGSVRIIDFMPPRQTKPDVVRIVEGTRGRVDMEMELIIRFDYGYQIPWVRTQHGALTAVAGPDGLCLRTDVPHHGRDLTTVAEFSVREGDSVPFVLTWYPSHERLPHPVDAEEALRETAGFWEEWSSRCKGVHGDWQDTVLRSLITLKALTYAPTGGIVAAATTSLPEVIGGVRNWDYRFCWVRDATLTLDALLAAGYLDEARSWRDWLLRAAAGSPEQLQIMYGPAGERRLPELEVPWLPGYERSAPVRIGNAAAGQFQLDVYGELMDAMERGRSRGLHYDADSWGLQVTIANFVCQHWSEPDEGIWEVRGGRRHFVHSKVMAWVALDRAVKAAQELGLEAPLDHWRAHRQQIHDEVCSKGYDSERKAFTQYYGSKALDASALMIPLVGFLPANDERVRGTVDAIQQELTRDGFVLRYAGDAAVDGLPEGEGAFLACTFWLVDNLALLGRLEEARQLYERLLSLANDVGLLTEEYDPVLGRLVGNFPQAFSHVGLINAGRNLTERLDVERSP